MQLGSVGIGFNGSVKVPQGLLDFLPEEVHKPDVVFIGRSVLALLSAAGVVGKLQVLLPAPGLLQGGWRQRQLAGWGEPATSSNAAR